MRINLLRQGGTSISGKSSLERMNERSGARWRAVDIWGKSAAFGPSAAAPTVWRPTEDRILIRLLSFAGAG
jgi:hypothetical protein